MSGQGRVDRPVREIGPVLPVASRVQRRVGRRPTVLDLAFVLATAFFFGLSIAWALGCDRIARSRP